LLDTHALLLTYELQARQLELEIQNQELGAHRVRLEAQNQELCTQQTRLEVRNEQLCASQQELLRAKDALADLYEHAPVGYVTSTDEGVVLSANLRFAALLDVERDILVGRPLSDWVVRDDQDAYRHRRQQLQEGAGRRVCELRMRRASGETLWVALESVVVDSAEVAGQMRSAVSDITQRKRAEQEPFFTTKEVGEGTGLGLSMVYGAVRELKGDVRIVSRLGCGTTVRLLLPVCPSAVARRSSIPARGPATLPGHTVLLVDDEPMVRAAFARVLEGLGCHVMVADGGPSALKLYEAHAHEISAVLLDLSMPVVDGAECYARLRALDPNVRVVICTGRARTEAAERLVAQGVPHLVAKPCSPEELALALAEAVQTAPPIAPLQEPPRVGHSSSSRPE
jgi:PAS domain S-box-containing protein